MSKIETVVCSNLNGQLVQQQFEDTKVLIGNRKLKSMKIYTNTQKEKVLSTRTPLKTRDGGGGVNSGAPEGQALKV